MKRTVVNLICGLFVVAFFALAGTLGWAMPDKSTEELFFTKAGTPYQSRILELGFSKVVIVTDSFGNVVLAVSQTIFGVRINFYEIDALAYFPLPQPYTRLETDSALNDFALHRFAAFLVNNLEKQKLGVLDEPGCDGFPDSCCSLNCCYEHDKCYAENGCDASSWFEHDTNCTPCNRKVVACMLVSCSTPLSITTALTDVLCYDAACDLDNATFSCPRKNLFDCNCDCQSTCANNDETTTRDAKKIR